MPNKRNPFNALCELATKENWCWKIFCTTCNHMHFQYGFMELIKGKHPDDNSWQVSINQKLPTYEHSDFLNSINWPLSDQYKLATILSGSFLDKITEIKGHTSWLGYLGLGLMHTEQNEKINKILTKDWVPQILNILPKYSTSHIQLQNLLISPKETLTWQFLEEIEFDLLIIHRKPLNVRLE